MRTPRTTSTLVAGAVLAASALSALLAAGASGAASSISVAITEAPTSLAVAGDFKYVDALATNASGTTAGPYRWHVTFDATAPLAAGDIYAEQRSGSSWLPIELTVANGDVTGDIGVPQGFSVRAGGDASVEVRFLVIDGADAGPGAFVSGLDVGMDVTAAGSSAVLAGDSAQSDVRLLAIDGPPSTSVRLEQPTEFQVVTRNTTGSNFADVAVIPSSVYAGSASGPASRSVRPAALLGRIRHLEATTGTSFEWLRDGTFTSIASLGDLPVVSLQEGETSKVTWRITFHDPAMVASGGSITWNAVRTGFDVGPPAPTGPHAPSSSLLYFAGQRTWQLSVTGAAASTSTPSATAAPTASPTSTSDVEVGTSGGGGDASAATPSPLPTITAAATAAADGDASGDSGALARTGLDLLGRFRYAVGLVLAGLVTVVATRRRTGSPSRYE